MNNTVLSKDFYFQDTIEVSQQLLGKKLSHQLDNGQILSGLITETEAYLGAEDPSCHSFGLKKTPRIQSMYLPGGHSYVYFIYGMYFCFNVVTGDRKTPEAVLIRAVQPIEGLEQIKQFRNHRKDLCGGPGKLTQAFNMDRRHDGLCLQSSAIQIFDSHSISEKNIKSLERVGIESSGDAAFWPLRFKVQLDKTQLFDYGGTHEFS